MTFEEWWSEYEETDNYLNGATNESTAFEAWHARDAEIERLTTQRDALLKVTEAAKGIVVHRTKADWWTNLLALESALKELEANNDTNL